MFDRHLTGEEVAEALHLCNSVASKLATLGVAAAADLIRTAASLIDQSDVGVAKAIGLCTILDDARVAVASTVAGTVRPAKRASTSSSWDRPWSKPTR